MCPGKDGVWPGERLGGHELHCLQEVVQEDTLSVCGQICDQVGSLLWEASVPSPGNSLEVYCTYRWEMKSGEHAGSPDRAGSGQGTIGTGRTSRICGNEGW